MSPKFCVILETATESACRILRYWLLKQVGIEWEDVQVGLTPEFKPTVAVVTLDPARLVREVTPLTLCLEDWRKARDFAAQGQRVLVLCGGRPAKEFLGYGANASKWRGSYSIINAP